VLVALIVGGAILLWGRASTFNDRVSSADALSSRLWSQIGGESRVNVAMFGYSDESREGAYLADSITILSIEPSTDATTLIPIPRDLWVEGLAEVPDNLKINEAFATGYYADGFANAGALASRAVMHVTGLEIDGWIALDFDGFAAMVNAIGGVTVDNPRAFRFTWTEEAFNAGRFERQFPQGTLDLNGGRALAYARARYTDLTEESSDFARSIRQQRVLSAIRDKLDGPSALPRGLAMMDALETNMHTDLSIVDLGQLAGHLRIDRRIELKQDEVVAATTNTLGQYILIVIGQESTSDYSPLHEYIARELDRSIPSPSAQPSRSP
jgi:LCP family protein required for cell wall assembly